MDPLERESDGRLSHPRQAAVASSVRGVRSPATSPREGRNSSPPPSRSPSSRRARTVATQPTTTQQFAIGRCTQTPTALQHPRG